MFYIPDVKQEKCIVCGKELFDRQLKYCSEACYANGRYGRRELITEEMVNGVKNITIKKIYVQLLTCYIIGVYLNYQKNVGFDIGGFR